jgi:hypothetical protein
MRAAWIYSGPSLCAPLRMIPHRAEKSSTCTAISFVAAQKQLTDFKMEDVHNYVGSAIQQNNVSADEHVRAIGRWWRQLPLEVFGTGLESFPKTWRERTAPHKLFFQSGRQLVSLGKSGRKIVLVVVIPSAHGFTVLTLIEVLTLVVIISVFMVAPSLSISVTLGQRKIRGEHGDCQCAREQPFCRFHFPLRSEGR